MTTELANANGQTDEVNTKTKTLKRRGTLLYCLALILPKIIAYN